MAAKTSLYVQSFDINAAMSASSNNNISQWIRCLFIAKVTWRNASRLFNQKFDRIMYVDISIYRIYIPILE